MVKEYKTMIFGKPGIVMDFTTPGEYPKGGTEWVMMHPSMNMDALGFLPSFLHHDDPRSAREQFNANYEFGGWRDFGSDMFKMGKDFSLNYPGDPTLYPLAMTRLRDEMIFFYQASIVAIVQKDGSFEVARLD